ncbi:MAG: MarR family transcriptional regulator [Thermoplasmata archaeon]|nr:MarR family transcriptional regulator [Thermoplasmata archaeon]
MEPRYEKVLEAMRTFARPARAGEIAEAAGMEKDECTEIINRLKKEDLIVSPKRCFFTVKEPD